MLLLILEALFALLALLLIIWWTMFSGRSKGELPGTHAADTPANPPPDEPGRK